MKKETEERIIYLFSSFRLTVKILKALTTYYYNFYKQDWRDW